MQYYIKQKVFSIADKYNIYNISNDLIYEVKGEFLSFTPHFTMYDNSGYELYSIRKKISIIFEKYEVRKGGRPYALIKREFSLMKPIVSIKSDEGDFTIKGDYFAHDFDIYEGVELVARVTKMWISFGDSYEISVIDYNDPAFICAMVIAIDNCIHSEDD